MSRDMVKLRAAQNAVDALPDGPGKEALVFAVLQWMHAAFISHEPLTDRERAWAKKVAAAVDVPLPAAQGRDRYPVSDDWRAPSPTWCPLPILVTKGT